MPDIFIASTQINTAITIIKLIRKNYFSTFSLDYTNEKQAALLSKYKTMEKFKKDFKISKDLIKSFIDGATAANIEFDQSGLTKARNNRNYHSRILARNLYGQEAYYYIIGEIDEELNKAINC